MKVEAAWQIASVDEKSAVVRSALKTVGGLPKIEAAKRVNWADAAEGAEPFAGEEGKSSVFRKLARQTRATGAFLKYSVNGGNPFANHSWADLDA